MLITASSSSFWGYLERALNREEVTPSLLELAVHYKLPKALEHQLGMFEQGSEQWLLTLKTLAKDKPNYALVLGQYYQNLGQLRQAKLWLTPHLTHTKVRHQYAEILTTQGRLSQAFELVIQDAQLHSTDLLLELAVALGETKFINQLIEAPDFKIQQYDKLANLGFFKLFSNSNKVVMSQKPAKQCTNSIAVVATTLNDFKRADTLFNQLDDSALGKLFCVVQRQYIPITWFDCQLTQGQPILCDESLWYQISEIIEADYVVTLLPEGGANVYRGVMYLDRSDTHQVLAHELAHFIGFIDEYAVRENHELCLKAPNSPGNNIVVFSEDASNLSREELLQHIPWAPFISAETPLWQDENGRRKLGTPKVYAGNVGLYVSETCQRSQFIAYKPVRELGMMRYFEQPMPDFYLRLLAQLGAQYRQPTFATNYSQ